MLAMQMRLTTCTLIFMNVHTLHMQSLLLQLLESTKNTCSTEMSTICTWRKTIYNNNKNGIQQTVF